MIEGHLVDLVPFEGDFVTHFETWINEDAWFRTMFYERRQPLPERDVKKTIEQMQKPDRGVLFGYQTKGGDPVGAAFYDRQEERVWKVDVMFFAGDTRYEHTDEHLDGLLMLVRYCFETRNYHRLDTFALAFDERKIECLRRAGFTPEGSLRQHILWGGEYVNVEVLGILQREWPGYAAMVQKLDLRASGIPLKQN